MALSGALIIRGGFLPGRLARESPKNAKSSANADSPSSWHLDNSAFPVVCFAVTERVEKGNGDDRRFSRFFLRLRGAKDTWQTVTKNTRNTKNKKKKTPPKKPLCLRRVFSEQRVDDVAEPRDAPNHVRGLRGARRRGRPRGVYPHRRAERRADPPLRRERDEKEERQTSGRTRQRRVCSGRANEEKRPFRKHTQ